MKTKTGDIEAALAMMSTNEKRAATNRFLDTVMAWALARHDPRVVHEANGDYVINDVAQVCADFCRYMADITEAAANN